MPATKFGIIGCGGAAVAAGEAIVASPYAALIMVHDIAETLAASLGQRFQVPFTTQLEAFLATPDLDAVYIAVPHDCLAPLAQRALEAGKHVLVEKPMALTLAEADELIALADRQRLALGVFYEYRLAGPYAQAREIIQAGALGRIIGVRFHTLIDKPMSYWGSGLAGRLANPWRGLKARAGGGVLLMNTSHQFDAVRYITGLEIVSVAAHIATLAAPGEVKVEDSAAVTLRFNNGAVGSVFAGAHIPGASAGERCDIYGTDGQLSIPDPYTDDLSDPLRVYLRQPWRDIPAAVWQMRPRSIMPVFSQSIDNFARAVQQGEIPPISGRDGRRVLAVVLAIYEAAAQGRTITIQTDEGQRADD
jgi:UDP-N-acetyl-2-amino-2-deoxyglucuronate dehydrogenase